MEKAETRKRWKICVQPSFQNCEYIYPIQQKKVKELVNYLKENENVIRIVVFGSSVTESCHAGSDVDIYLDLKKEEYPIKKAFHFVFDLWTNYTVDDRLYQEIESKGVVVYEQ